MSSRSRIDYMNTPPAPATRSEPSPEVMAVELDTANITSKTLGVQSADLQTVAHEASRMQQNREQLNVRLSMALKRQVAARATLEGLSVYELIEHMLLEYLAEKS